MANHLKWAYSWDSLASRKEDPRHIINTRPALPEKATTPLPLDDVQIPTPNTTHGLVFSMFYQDRPKHMFDDSSHASKACAPRRTTPSVASSYTISPFLEIYNNVVSLIATPNIVFNVI